MTLLYLYPQFRLRVAIFVSVFLMLAACSNQTPMTSNTASVVNNQVAEAPSIQIVQILESPIQTVQTLASSFISSPTAEPALPVIPVAQNSISVSIESSNKPTDSIAFWLGEAGWAYEQDKLTTPKGESAYYYLTRVLTKEPGNPKALMALEKIVQRYYVLLQSSLTQDKVEQARVFLSRANKVMPNHSQLTAMQSLIESHVVKQQVAVVAGPKITMPETKMPAMRTQTLLLSTKLIEQQDKALAQWLVVVAAKAHELQATMLIVVPTDSEARWVYQTMNSADPDQRIRANIKRSRPARIEVSYLARKDELEVYSN
ncbi:MAG: hypothetical protein ACI9GE_000208 [Oceanospirillaceae bacterium]|jgi:hypothetical protein